MIVYVESNFVLELAYLRDEQESCEEILALAQAQKVQLVLPAFSVGEPYESWVRRSKQRAELLDKLTAEIKELARSKPYADSAQEFHEITNALRRSAGEEKRRLDDAMNRVLESALVAPIGRDTLRSAIDLQRTRNLSPQDSIVYASVLSHVKTASEEPKCFLTKNSKDFANPDVYNDLTRYDCKLLTSFKSGLGFVQARM